MNKDIQELEEWRPCAGDIGKSGYICSNLGRIARVLEGGMNRVTGYKQSSFIVNGKKIYRTQHSIIAEAFLGTRPPGYVINHLDENKTNNRADNLEYCTPYENVHWSRYRYCKPDD